MTLAQLANFIRIAELRSLTKAAAVIRIAQPALSRQIRNLEAELGSPLLVRHAWGVTLTVAGEILLGHARRLIEEAESTRDAVLAVKKVPAGRVAVGVPSSLATALLPSLSAVIAGKFPQLQPHFVDGFSAVLHKRAIAGELDLAILYDDKAMGPLATTPLLSEELVLVSDGHADLAEGPLAMMIAGRPLIVPGKPNRLRLLIDEALAGQGLDRVPVIEVDSLPAIVEIVRSGGGLTLLPYSSVAAAEQRGELKIRTLDSVRLTRTLLLVRPLGKQRTIGVDAVETEIRELVRNMADGLGWKALC